MRRVLVVLILLAAAVGAVIWVRGKEANQHGRGGTNAPVPVVIAKAETQNVPVYLDALGTVQAFNTVTVRAMVDGPLIEVNFKEGQDVKAGDVLARIDPRSYQAALDQAIAKKAQDEANLANARLDLARYIKLAKTNYTSQQQADTQRATVAQLEAQVKQDQASIDSARTQLSYCTIVSPLDGRTGIRQIDQGNIIHTTDTNGLVVITQLHPISVIFTLPQQDLGAVMQAQQAGPVKVLAFPQGMAPAQGAGTAGSQSGPGLSASAAASGAVDPPASPSGPQLDAGVLAVVDNQVDQSTGTIKLKATFPNKQLKLWPGGFVTVQLLARTENAVTTVPPVAVQRGPNNTFVYVVDDAGTAHRRTVSVGYQDPNVAVIAQGLKPGEQVVVDGASRLNEGTKVAIAQPGGTPNATPAPPSTAARHTRQHGGSS